MATGADGISGLPEGVLHHILSLLPARDAVRTCVLARSWRNRWRSAPALRFAYSSSDGDIDAFGSFVDGLLRVRRGGLPLESCDFDLDVADLDPCCYDLDLDLYGNSWIRRVLALKVRELRFRISCNPNYDPFVWYHNPFSQHLKSLDLTGVQDEYSFDFSECPALESLKMEACDVLSEEIHSGSVKHLSIKYCSLDSRIRLSFPSLVSFEFINNSGRAPMLERMLCLKTAKVRFDRHHDDRCKNGRLDDCGDDNCQGCFYYYYPDGSGSVFLHGLAEATYLDLSAYPDMYVFSRDLEWCPAFNKLKTLKLSKWFLTTDLSALIWFLHHTPVLEKLELRISKDFNETEGSYNPLEKSIAPSNLQIVEIVCKDVDGTVLNVLKVLNANGIPLGKIRIQCSGRYNFVCSGVNK